MGGFDAFRWESSAHDPEIESLASVPVDRLAAHAVDYIMDVVCHDALKTACHHAHNTALLNTLLRRILEDAEVSTAVVLVALSYVKRALVRSVIKARRWQCERMFIGALMLAHKYINDTPFATYFGVYVAGSFKRHELSALERDFLTLIDYDLCPSSEELYAHYDPLMELCVRRPVMLLAQTSLITPPPTPLTPPRIEQITMRTPSTQLTPVYDPPMAFSLCPSCQTQYTIPVVASPKIAILRGRRSTSLEPQPVVDASIERYSSRSSRVYRPYPQARYNCAIIAGDVWQR
ncbi:uncharacterized protein LAESUDRAFT_808224 [Laetiporus sulphureus 93-53]|uniref:Cyclin N-terminal domain-containing protein n=1 Tax=Laetiporus sulphureus 93-53 TaxID=1314785 RepID=A0A165I6J9_9APHY|nr:uncharacterized protein LAESUDRAFT_808224 [Laetiporus sulphureus 93-53]KZT12660.1 hypothetical protein LAESUDRAFT_808224 [Laetiporus sulphureus 93-53]